jgi:hypothetical protein
LAARGPIKGNEKRSYLHALYIKKSDSGNNDNRSRDPTGTITRQRKPRFTKSVPKTAPHAIKNKM